MPSARPKPNESSALPGGPLARVGVRLWAAVVATAVIALGAFFRPDAGQAPTAPPEEAPGPILQQVVERRESQSTFRRMQEAAGSVVRYAALVEVFAAPAREWSDIEPVRAAGLRERYGLVVADRQVLFDALDLPDSTRARVTLGDGRGFEGEIVARYPDRLLALLRLSTGEPVAAPRAAQTPQPGEAVFAAARGPSGTIVAPLFIAGIAADHYIVTTTTEPFRGIPVFNDSGHAVGIITGVPGSTRVLALEAATAPVAPAPPPAAPSLGITLRLDVEADSGHDAVPQIYVRSVAPDGRAARAGFRPGDVILAVGGTPPADLDDAVRTLGSAASTVDIRVRRGGRTVTLRLPPAAGSPL